MSQQMLITNLVDGIERIKATEDPWAWPSEEIARIAMRRWASYSRRHPKAKRVTDDERVLDLAKGLAAHFEPDIPYTPLSDWRALAKALAEVLSVGPH